ncbi:type II 3-dehydroquinate dehydratase [Cryobacterium sp. Y62]|uniref:type II 3-dehydroquinate dehydratase n=1 Tax=Cryobacterium sp. Y62 TaxID=2048284 RepID=UPI000CE4BC35|nr:type II 3-dehydroquinate dehydratase [Cryobacterium sp. Y62]
MTSFFRGESTKKWRIGVIDGPNMINLGKRDQGTYGAISSYYDLKGLVERVADELGVEVVPIVTNHEGEILDWIHATSPELDGFLINPAGLTTYGEATRHALEDSRKPYIETHFSNTIKHFAKTSPHIRLESRFTSTALGLSMGMRQYSYVGALVGLVMILDDPTFEV